MNTFINIFFVFIFIFLILFFKVPNINDNNYILHKVILFGLLFVYQFMLLVMSKVKNKCKIDFLEVFRYSVETAAIAVIGYSIYTDLQYYKVNDDPLFITDTNMQYLYITIIISVLLTFVNTIKLMFGYRPYDCIKYE
ncbi:hypothetical protein QKU48_gp0557 [Fadolivirus algeromassiliense]|jgi:hypothetical protein|uniref:Uncharacterized protein n=1 Tax=Fadolivirus FV1/VV64 TaxID=3070911 RepID=A0A7D3V5I2_9VIRU|nr:hypothetical protein QKU48_gp0557 [Fadolivirus algeromassiliense]QKF94015.1 hypothetical protein Fadolivirus_1_557 [Fadolivirus FV1/VV64]